MNPTITHAARMMNARRVKKNGKAGMKDIAAKGVQTKIERYGNSWADLTRQGKKLIHVPPLSPKE